MDESGKKTLLQHDQVKSVLIYSSAINFLGDLGTQPRPDIIIADMFMPGISGLKLVELSRILTGNPLIKIMLLCSSSNIGNIKKCLLGGASGFLAKDISTEELTGAILEVSGGNHYIAKSIRHGMSKNITREEPSGPNLSIREVEVLGKVCTGQTIKEIASGMNLSIHTVQYYHRNVLRKLKLRRTSELIVFAMQHGLYMPR